jgi:hypothetical protein
MLTKISLRLNRRCCYILLRYQQQVLDLEHYLDVLEHKPGALFKRISNLCGL